MLGAMREMVAGTVDGAAGYVAAEAKSSTANWKTTGLGILVVAYVLVPAFMAMFDGKPETVANWMSVASNPNLALGIGLILAKDGK